jgi:hypothetical protein
VQDQLDRGRRDEAILALASVFVATALTLLAGAGAAAAGVVTETTHWKDVPFTLPDSDCSGAPVSLSGLSSGTQHLTLLDSGGVHVTFTEVVTFTALRGTETFFGRWTSWSGFNLNDQNTSSTFTFAATGTSDAGTKLLLRVTAHFSMSATGVVREFERFTCVD